MDMYGNQYTNPMKVSDNIIWHNPDRVFECQCKSSVQHSELVQVLLPLKLCKDLPKASPVQLEDYRAMIFGHNVNFKHFWKDTGDPEVGELPSPPGESETQFYDSGIGETSTSSAMKDSRNLPESSSPQLSSETETLTLEHYTVGIVCALYKELLAVRALFDSRHKNLEVATQDINHYVLGHILQHNVVAACLPCGEYGINSAANVVSHMIRSFSSVKFCLLIGIEGGIPSEQNDIRLGDVVVSLPVGTHPGVIQYDLGKALESGIFERIGYLQRPPYFLLTAISSLRSHPTAFPTTRLDSYIKDIQALASKYKHPGQEHDKLFVAEYVHDPAHETCEQCSGPQVKRQPRPGDNPSVHYGLVASGNRVMKDAQIRDCLREKDNILCFEMETARVINTILCLVIRGICDYSDSHKNELWQEYAAATTAAYAKLLLSVVRNANDLESTAADSDTVKSVHSRKRAVSSLIRASSPPKRPRQLLALTRDFSQRNHVRSDTGERPFACTECGRAFTRASDCKRHEKIHTRR